MLIAVAAMDLENCIGKNGKVPFDLCDDRRYFSNYTKLVGTTCAGRVTQKEVDDRLGGPLPKRRNLVLSRNLDCNFPGCEVITNHLQIVEMAREQDICVIGGGEIYKILLPYTQKLVVTHVDACVKGDTYFPWIDPNEWTGTEIAKHYRQERRNEFSFRIVEYVRSNGQPRT